MFYEKSLDSVLIVSSLPVISTSPLLVEMHLSAAEGAGAGKFCSAQHQMLFPALQLRGFLLLRRSVGTGIKGWALAQAPGVPLVLQNFLASSVHAGRWQVQLLLPLKALGCP